MRLLILALLSTARLLACSCIGATNPCSSIGVSTMVFVASVLVDSGEGWGVGPARVLIEEPLWNTPNDLRDVEVDASAGSSCYVRLRAGERYVIFAHRTDDRPGRLSTGVCFGSFPLQSNEHILDALRGKARGEPSRLVGTVHRSTGSYSRAGGVPGATVSAHSATAHYEAISSSSGVFEFRGMAPGRYQIAVSRSGFLPDDEFNRRWSGRLVTNSETNTLGPDRAEPRGTVFIGERSCEVWDLSMWPRGRISGAVTGVNGEPLDGITVQAFAFQEDGTRAPKPLMTAKTGAGGKYLIDLLPGGDYAVGVNAETSADRDGYPPAVYSRDVKSAIPARVPVVVDTEVPDVNLVLSAKRVSTMLRVKVTDPDGTPAAGVRLILENLAGVQRWCPDELTPANGTLELPVYIGERYIVRAMRTDYRLKPEPGKDDFAGTSPLEVTSDHPSTTVVLALQPVSAAHQSRR